MSVVGIGTDIVQISRITTMSASAQVKLAQRVLTDTEFEKYQGLKVKEAFLAKRWAAKEAAAKAIGTGIASGVSFQHFEVVSLASGQPTLVLSGRALELAQSLQASSWHISLSDEKEYATAFVVLSK